MWLPSVHAAVPDVDGKVLSRARDYAAEGDKGPNYNVVDGYLFKKNLIGNISGVRIIDIPGKVFSVDAIGYGSRGYAPAEYTAGFRHPWKPGNVYPLPDSADVEERVVPTAIFGTAPTVAGLYPTQQVSGDYSTDSFGGASYTLPLTTRGSGPCGPNTGFWRCQLESEAQLTVTDFYPFGDPSLQPAHWLSVMTGYGRGTSLLDVRITPDYVQALAQGYYFAPPSNGGKVTTGLNGGQGGTWPMASACRRTVADQDLLAVAIPVANTGFPDFFWEYDTGESGLLVLLFSVTADSVVLLRHHLYTLADLPAGVQVDTVPVGADQAYVFNNANMQSVCIDDTGAVVVHGCWATSKWVDQQDLGAGQVDGPGTVPILNWYKAIVAVDAQTLSVLYTQVYVSAAKDYDNHLSLDDNPASPGVPFPTDVASMIGEEGQTGAIAWCRQFDRSAFTLGGGSSPLTGRNFVADPVACFVFNTASFQSITGVYYSTYRYIVDDINPYPVWSHFPPWFGSGAYDTRQLLFVGFDRTNLAQRVRFMSIDVFDGTITYDPLPTIITGEDVYFVPPKVNTFQQKLFEEDTRENTKTPPGIVASFIVIADAGGVAYTYLHRGGGVWEAVPAMTGFTGAHYFGNGLFGQTGRLFEEEGF